jgi:hypothetical protein
MYLVIPRGKIGIDQGRASQALPFFVCSRCGLQCCEPSIACETQKQDLPDVPTNFCLCGDPSLAQHGQAAYLGASFR